MASALLTPDPFCFAHSCICLMVSSVWRLEFAPPTAFNNYFRSDRVTAKCCISVWVTQCSHPRTRDLFPFVLVIL